jgi:integrase
MRLPHYLALSPSGVFHFRLRVPRAQRHALGREVRHSLRTREPGAAQLAAQVLAQRYALAFRAGRAVDAKKLIEEAEQALRSGGAMERYKVSLPGFEFEANNAAEHRQVVEMLREARAVLAPPPAPPQPTAPLPAPEWRVPVPRPDCSLRAAVRRYEHVLKRAMMPPKTRTQKQKAVASFYEFFKPDTVLATIHRADVAQWIDALRAAGNATPTLRNKTSYLTAFFAEAQRAGLYPSDAENPAAGVVAYGTREKRHRRALGFQPFTPAQIAALFAPEAFADLSPAARWGAVLGLYTGARVSEIGQALVADFVDRDGVLCLSINAGAGKSIKTQGSARTVPLHPDLRAMGLPERLAALRSAGVRRFFGERGADSKVNGAGNWLSKAWSYYLAKRGFLGEDGGRLGFHSLRKTITQRLQDAGVSAEHRAALLGHELADVHHYHYTRPPTIPELYRALEQGISTGLDIEALRLLLLESPESPPHAQAGFPALPSRAD